MENLKINKRKLYLGLKKTKPLYLKKNSYLFVSKTYYEISEYNPK